MQTVTTLFFFTAHLLRFADKNIETVEHSRKSGCFHGRGQDDKIMVRCQVDALSQCHVLHSYITVEIEKLSLSHTDTLLHGGILNSILFM